MRLRVEYGEITPLNAMAITGFLLLFLLGLATAMSALGG